MHLKLKDLELNHSYHAVFTRKKKADKGIKCFQMLLNKQKKTTTCWSQHITFRSITWTVDWNSKGETELEWIQNYQLNNSVTIIFISDSRTETFVPKPVIHHSASMAFFSWTRDIPKVVLFINKGVRRPWKHDRDTLWLLFPWHI